MNYEAPGEVSTQKAGAMPRKKRESNEEVLQLLTSINLMSTIPVYLQLENHVRFSIAAGRLSDDDQLPSVRELSERLALHSNTVMKAYQELTIMGILYSRRGKGFLVQAGAKKKCQAICREHVVSRLHEVTVESRKAGMARDRVDDIVTRCLASGARPYSPPPPSLLEV